MKDESHDKPPMPEAKPSDRVLSENETALLDQRMAWEINDQLKDGTAVMQPVFKDGREVGVQIVRKSDGEILLYEDMTNYQEEE